MLLRSRVWTVRALSVALAGSALVLGGCGQGVTTDPPVAAAPSEPVGGSSSDAPVPMRPADLVGLWRLAGAPEKNGVLRIAAESNLSLWSSCGRMSGQWAANAAGLMVASIDSGSGRCDVQKAARSSWLHDVAGYRRGEAGPELLDSSGGVVARLLPGARLTPGPDVAPSEVEVPTLPEQPRPHWQALPDLPRSVVPVSREQLLGAWVPAGEDRRARPERPHVRFHPDGSWTGSDGCNGTGGRWALGHGGAVLLTSGITTLIGCGNVNVLGSAPLARAAVDRDGFLVLYDFSGAPVQSLRSVPVAEL